LEKGKEACSPGEGVTAFQDSLEEGITLRWDKEGKAWEIDIRCGIASIYKIRASVSLIPTNFP